MTDNDLRTGMTRIHISIFTCVGAFLVSSLSLSFGYFLIDKGSTGTVLLNVVVEEGIKEINFYCYVPGVIFALLGASIAFYALNRLIGKN